MWLLLDQMDEKRFSILIWKAKDVFAILWREHVLIGSALGAGLVTSILIGLSVSAQGWPHTVKVFGFYVFYGLASMPITFLVLRGVIRLVGIFVKRDSKLGVLAISLVIDLVLIFLFWTYSDLTWISHVVWYFQTIGVLSGIVLLVASSLIAGNIELELSSAKLEFIPFTSFVNRTLGRVKGGTFEFSEDYSIFHLSWIQLVGWCFMLLAPGLYISGRLSRIPMEGLLLSISATGALALVGNLLVNIYGRSAGADAGEIVTSHEWRTLDGKRWGPATKRDAYEYYHGRGSWYASIQRTIRFWRLVAIVVPALAPPLVIRHNNFYIVPDSGLVCLAAVLTAGSLIIAVFVGKR